VVPFVVGPSVVLLWEREIAGCRHLRWIEHRHLIPDSCSFSCQALESIFHVMELILEGTLRFLREGLGQLKWLLVDDTGRGRGGQQGRRQYSHIEQLDGNVRDKGIEDAMKQKENPRDDGLLKKATTVKLGDEAQDK